MTMQTFTGKQYLKIDTANNFGLDKLDWDDRIEWFDSNEYRLDKLLTEAGEPALYYASILAWNQSKQGMVSNYPISLDATASGLQVLSLLTGCPKSAALCNVIDTGHRRDAYTLLYQMLMARTDGTAKIDRDDVKHAVMTSFYSSKRIPREVFGEGELLEKYYETVTEEAPGAWELNESFLAMWNPDAYVNEWVLPDGFHVRDKVMGNIYEKVHFLNQPYDIARKINRPIQEGRSLSANATHSIDGMIVREMVRRCNYDPRMVQLILRMDNTRNRSVNRPRDKKVIELWDRYAQSGFLSTRILGYLDEKNMGHTDYGIICQLVNTLPRKPFEILTVHDCFRCLPNYANEMRMQYNVVLAQIAGSTLLANIVSQLLGKPITVNKQQDLTHQVLGANYALS
jgi:hypothetical protein